MVASYGGFHGFETRPRRNSYHPLGPLFFHGFMEKIADYTHNLKNGDWQKKRLEIFNRDGFRCRNCNSKDALCVHHILYEHTLPWLTQDKYLISLCDQCHKKEENLRLKKFDYYEIVKESGLTRLQLINILAITRDYFSKIKFADINSHDDFIKRLSVPASTLLLLQEFEE